MLVSLSFNNSCMKHGFGLFKVSYTSTHKGLSRDRVIVGLPDFSKSSS